MGSYSIKELEKLSGIKAHTIRIWEKRHHLITPGRTSTNIRYYSDEDLKKLINVSLLNSQGVKISKIALMSSDELQSKIVEISMAGINEDSFANQLLAAMIDMKEAQFEKLFGHLIMKFGFEKAITGWIYPFLDKIGILWQTGNITPAQEHFISNLIRQKLIVAIDSLPFPADDAVKAVLFLPEDEFHEIGLLFHHYITKRIGVKTFYMGQHLPYKDLQQVCQSHRPTYVITSLTSSSKPEKTFQYLHDLITDFPKVKVLASGALLSQLPPHLEQKVIPFRGSDALKQLLIG